MDHEAFEWYSKGVERQLRITRLYEYYMMAIYTDEEGRLPCEISRMVLMYFSYQSDLDYEKNAIQLATEKLAICEKADDT